MLKQIEKLKVENLDDTIEIGEAFAAEVEYPGGFTFPSFSAQWGPMLSTSIGEIFVVRSDDNRIVGLLGAAFAPDGFSGWLTALEQFWFILPEYRSQGIALQLFAAFEAEARARGCKRILMVHLDGPLTKNLESLYHKFGYSSVEKTFAKTI